MTYFTNIDQLFLLQATHPDPHQKISKQSFHYKNGNIFLFKDGAKFVYGFQRIRGSYSCSTPLEGY